MDAPVPSWNDADLVMISALQHYSYCPRQCGLIHLDQAWDENLYTLRGRRVHELVDIPGGETAYGVRIERGLPLWSDRLGLIGKADVVEFPEGTPLPVEYKHGPRRQSRHDELQLAAQAICLEEMFDTTIGRGVIYHHTSRRRREIVIGAALRSEVEQAIRLVRSMLQSRRLPVAVNDSRCDKCSLRESCLPAVTDGKDRSVNAARSLFLVCDRPKTVG
jgi:CRISPR-associated exonuclease Cas4